MKRETGSNFSKIKALLYIFAYLPVSTATEKENIICGNRPHKETLWTSFIIVMLRTESVTKAKQKKNCDKKDTLVAAEIKIYACPISWAVTPIDLNSPISYTTTAAKSSWLSSSTWHAPPGVAMP